MARATCLALDGDSLAVQTQSFNLTLYGPVRVVGDAVSDDITLSALCTWSQHTQQHRIILYADDLAACDWLAAHGIDGVRCLLACRHAQHAALNVSWILETTAGLADTDVLCLINSDILLLPDFTSVMRHVFEDVHFERALVVGRRTDVRVSDVHTHPVNISVPLWADNLVQVAQSKGKLHGAYGIDYFVHTKQTWTRFAMPPFVVGAWRWDNLLLSEAVSDLGIVAIDATPCILAVHLQKTAAGTLPNHKVRKHTNYNDMLAKAHSSMQFMLGKSVCVL